MKITHTAATHTLFVQLQALICSMLQWSDEQYCAYMEKCGREYLQLYIPRDPQRIDELLATREYWAWWRTNWYQRDMQFAAGILGGDLELLQLMYQELHDPRTLARALYPNGVVLEAGYANMIQRVIDSKQGGGL